MTIAAISTALGEGGIGIIRLSGEDSLKIAQKIFRADKHPLSVDNPNRFTYGFVVDEQGALVDEVMAVFMKAPHSYSSEDVVELQCHGSYIILQKILQLVLNNGARLAQAAEFTQRAFLNGRLDLAQAEAVMDIIRSSSEAALKLAMRQHSGFLSNEISICRKDLKDVIVNIEAVIDYPEEDIPDLADEEIYSTMMKVQASVKKLIDTYNTGRMLKEGLRVVIAGRPNVGKSSLLNVLLKMERAIVSNIAGTTRDVIEEKLLIGGIPVVLVDTAGVRETEDVIEQIGVQKAMENMQSADLIMYMLDASVGITPEDEVMLDKISQEKHLVLVNKTDLLSEDAPWLQKLHINNDVIDISVRTGQGMHSLEEYLQKIVFGQSATTLSENVYVQNARHEQLLKTAADNLQEAAVAYKNSLPLDCVVIDLREAVYNLGKITGETVTDEIITEIFARFCIGK